MTDQIVFSKSRKGVSISFCIDGTFYPQTWSDEIRYWPDEAEAWFYLCRIALLYEEDYGQDIGWRLEDVAVIEEEEPNENPR